MIICLIFLLLQERKKEGEKVRKIIIINLDLDLDLLQPYVAASRLLLLHLSLRFHQFGEKLPKRPANEQLGIATHRNATAVAVVHEQPGATRHSQR